MARRVEEEDAEMVSGVNTGTIAVVVFLIEDSGSKYSRMACALVPPKPTTE
jgi:hypothetical protein